MDGFDTMDPYFMLPTMKHLIDTLLEDWSRNNNINNNGTSYTCGLLAAARASKAPFL